MAQPAAEDVLFEEIAEQARALAGTAHTPPDGTALPEALQRLSYDQYRDIRFHKANAFWARRAGSASSSFTWDFSTGNRCRTTR